MNLVKRIERGFFSGSVLGISLRELKECEVFRKKGGRLLFQALKLT
jgi:hypothetical protein